jgi:hypothetical protein
MIYFVIFFLEQKIDFIYKIFIIYYFFDQGLFFYKIFDTDALNIFLIKTTNVTKNNIFKNLKTRRRNIKNIFKFKDGKKKEIFNKKFNDFFH